MADETLDDSLRLANTGNDKGTRVSEVSTTDIPLIDFCNLLFIYFICL